MTSIVQQSKQQYGLLESKKRQNIFESDKPVKDDNTSEIN